MTTPFAPPTPPVVTPSADMVAAVSAGIRGLVDNANRLGLTWNLQLGTTADVEKATGDIPVILDGDSKPITAKAITGSHLLQGQRVYVVQVPPGGYFIIGALYSEWILPALQNSWVNFGAGFAPARYRKTSSGMVVLEGVVGSGVIGQPIYTLPPGYRPNLALIYAIDSGVAFGRIVVNPDGRVLCDVGTNVYVAAFATFFADQ